MITQVEDTPNGYIVGAFIYDEQGNGHWHRLRNFGERQGDAIEFREWDLPKMTLPEIKAFARTFRLGVTYIRKGFKNYRPCR